MSATISSCGIYRYTLSRRVAPSMFSTSDRRVLWVMLNPSTADASTDDPTIRRCAGFTERLGFESFVVVNLFALRATNPKSLLTPANGADETNDDHIARAANGADLIVVAWGANVRKPMLAHRPGEVIRILCATPRATPIVALGLLADGTPQHPLYMPYGFAPVPFR